MSQFPKKSGKMQEMLEEIDKIIEILSQFPKKSGKMQALLETINKKLEKIEKVAIP